MCYCSAGCWLQSWGPRRPPVLALGWTRVTQTRVGGGAAATPFRTGRQGSQPGVNTDQPEQRVPVPDCGPAKCQGLRGADGTRQTAGVRGLTAHCEESVPLLPPRAWTQGRQISLPRAILSSPRHTPRGHFCQPLSPGTLRTHRPGGQTSFLPSLRSAKAPSRAFDLQTVCAPHPPLLLHP